MASFSFIFPEDRHCSIKDNEVNSGWMSMVTQLNALGGPESESQKFRQSFAEELGDKYHYANAIDSSLLWTVGYTPYIPPALKGRSFPSVESFFLDEWEPLTLLQTPQVLSTSVSIEEDNLIQSTAGLVSQDLSTSVAIVENDLIQSAAGLVSQVLSTSVSIEEDNLIQSAAGLVSQVLSTSVAIVENDLIQSAAGLVSQVLSTSVAIVENDLIQSAAGLVSQVLSTSVAIVESDLIQSAAGLVSQVLSTSVAIVENDLIQSAAGLVSQVLSTSVTIVENDRIQSAAGLVSQVLSTSVSIVENDRIQSAAGLVSQVLSTSVSIVENDLIQSAAGVVSQVLSTSVAIVESDLIQSAAGLVSQELSSSDARVKDRDDSTLRDSNQPEVHVADVSTKRSRLVITISMFSTESCNASVHEVDAIATSLEHSAEKMSTSTADGHIVSSTAVANQKKTRGGFVSALRRLFTRKNRKPAKVASKKEHIHLVDRLNAEVTH
ncbi:topoisomerase I damage affected protein 7-like isoform X1 [Salmo salar]|uniref:Topoisomerase I damage affected protein 7-like isoform X1 n=1 Tax=Salmo salar TaxID=8030 RepID=A0ABM3DWJ0_SALSA|nr:topoisomerase I damage affected protein 7-like isoform X1 [Salmo salar]